MKLFATMFDYFIEFYNRLDRQGPGYDKCTKVVFRLLENLMSYPHITNVGCCLGRVVVILGFIAIADNNPLNAQTHSLYSADRNILLHEENGQNSDSRQRLWAAETSLTFHIVRIYMLKFSYKFSDRVELGIGPAFQNWKNEDQSFIGQANAYTLLLSYRYYFWRNFNVEMELWPAWNRFESFVDNNTYRGLELWAEYKMGYRLDLGQRFYLNIQPGIGHPVWQQNKWPGVEEYKNYFELIRNETIFVPQLMLGFRF